MAETTKSAAGRVATRTVPAVPWTTSVPVMPFSLRRSESWSARGSVAMEMSSGRQRWHWAKADVEVGAGGEGDGTEAVGVGLAEAEGALADGAGRAEEGDVLHLFSLPATARGAGVEAVSF